MVVLAEIIPSKKSCHKLISAVNIVNILQMRCKLKADYFEFFKGKLTVRGVQRSVSTDYSMKKSLQTHCDLISLASFKKNGFWFHR